MRDPFEQLERSHRRLEEHLDDLAAVAHEARETGRADAYRLDGVREIVGFFARAVRRHEDDEEKSLFPRLASDPSLNATIAKLTEEHRAHEVLHAALDRVVGVLDGAPEDTAAIAELDRVSTALHDAYRAHIEEEERTVFPRAREIVAGDAREAMAVEMENRRGGASGGGRGRGGGGGGR
ncbi:MAG: hemerythrin domain-containing protein [Deltaproteobacteria bacterium]|nr:hemerythrin domain-containing protein [Deltaproteobacteria bacterium]